MKACFFLTDCIKKQENATVRYMKLTQLVKLNIEFILYITIKLTKLISKITFNTTYFNTRMRFVVVCTITTDRSVNK